MRGDLAALDALRVGLLGRQGRLTGLLRDLGTLPAEERRERGAALNRLKGEFEAAIAERKRHLEAAAWDAEIAAERLDITLPPRPSPAGLIHPISRTIEEIGAIFGAMGFGVVGGPEIEDDWRNFGALNIPEHHPARAGHGHVLPAGAAGGPAARAPHPYLAGADPDHAGELRRPVA